ASGVELRTIDQVPVSGGAEITVEASTARHDRMVFDAVSAFLGQLQPVLRNGSRLRVEGTSSSAAEAYARQLSADYGVPVQLAGDRAARASDQRAMVYEAEAKSFEQRLARYLAGRDDVNDVVERVLKAAWAKAYMDERPRFGSTEVMDGSVGDGLDALRQV